MEGLREHLVYRCGISRIKDTWLHISLSVGVNAMANKTSKKSTKVAKPALLAGDNPQIAKADGDGPPVLRFEAQLFQHPKTAKTGFQTLLNVPVWVSKQFPSHVSTKVEGTIDGHPFRAALEPNTFGPHWLVKKKAMLRGAGPPAGNKITLFFLGSAPNPPPPADLRVALTA